MKNIECKEILGAANTSYGGWIATQIIKEVNLDDKDNPIIFIKNRVLPTPYSIQLKLLRQLILL